MGGCGKLYLSTLPSNTRIPLIISARNPTQMAKAKKKKGIYWLTKEIKSEVLGRTGSRALNPTTGIPQFLHISALLPLHWLHSWADPPERMDTGSSKHSAQHPSHASVINLETSLKLLFPNIPNRVLVPRLPEQSVHCG